jgi:hypothetical protein
VFEALLLQFQVMQPPAEPKHVLLAAMRMVPLASKRFDPNSAAAAAAAVVAHS